MSWHRKIQEYSVFAVKKISSRMSGGSKRKQVIEPSCNNLRLKSGGGGLIYMSILFLLLCLSVLTAS